MQIVNTGEATLVFGRHVIIGQIDAGAEIHVYGSVFPVSRHRWRGDGLTALEKGGLGPLAHAGRSLGVDAPHLSAHVCDVDQIRIAVQIQIHHCRLRRLVSFAAAGAEQYGSLPNAGGHIVNIEPGLAVGLVQTAADQSQ